MYLSEHSPDRGNCQSDFVYLFIVFFLVAFFNLNIRLCNFFLHYSNCNTRSIEARYFTRHKFTLELFELKQFKIHKKINIDH